MIECFFCGAKLASADLYRSHLEEHDRTNMKIDDFIREYKNTTISNDIAPLKKISQIKKYLTDTIIDYNMAYEINKHTTKLLDKFDNGNGNENSNISMTSTSMSSINNINNGTVINNPIIVNNITNNNYHIHIYNTSDKITETGLIDKSFLIDYNDNVESFLSKLVSDTRERNTYEYNYEGMYKSRLYRSEMSKLNKDIQVNLDKFVSAMMKKLVNLYGKIFFSILRPNRHNIYITHKKSNENFYIRDNNEWCLAGNLITLTNIANGVCDYLIDHLNTHGYEELSAMTTECFSYPRFKKDLINEFFKYGFSNREIISVTFNNTYIPPTINPNIMINNIPIVATNVDNSVKQESKKAPRMMFKNATNRISKNDNKNNPNNTNIIVPIKFNNECIDQQVANLVCMNINGIEYLVSEDNTAYYRPCDNYSQYKLDDLKIAGHKMYNYVILAS